MKYHYYKDLKKRIYIKRKELFKISSIFLIFSEQLSDLDRYKIYLKFFSSRKLNFELKNHCILTKNTKTVYRFTGLTRTNMKSLFENGFINGITHKSW